MTRSRIRVLAGALALAAACGDGIAPRETIVDVTLVSLVGPTVATDANGVQTISCEIELSAIAAGAGAATWLDATSRVWPVADPSTGGSTTQIGAEIVRQVWGFEEIFADETQTSRWIATHTSPFSATLDFRYRASPGGRILSSGVAFTCSP
jgi:hypothetical protein